jgi:hypothetical protein
MGQLPPFASAYHMGRVQKCAYAGIPRLERGSNGQGQPTAAEARRPWCATLCV